MKIGPFYVYSSVRSDPDASGAGEAGPIVRFEHACHGEVVVAVTPAELEELCCPPYVRVESPRAFYLQSTQPIPMLLWCPACGTRHIDNSQFRHKSHHTHACQACGMVWRPAVVDTVGVEFLPGFQDEAPDQ